jgi:putative addiction module CopG family antidote
MTITLTPDLEKIVNDQLAGGQFTTPEEVVRVGLQLLHQKYEELKTLIAESVEQARNGDIAPLDVKATLARVKASQLNRSRDDSCDK